jgi:hypothetical protein
VPTCHPARRTTNPHARQHRLKILLTRPAKYFWRRRQQPRYQTIVESL